VPDNTQDITLRANHRINILKGAALSFCGDKEEANILLRSIGQLHIETCPENLIHQLLILAEHKTRLQDCRGALQEMNKGSYLIFNEKHLSDKACTMFVSRMTIIAQASSSNITSDEQVVITNFRGYSDIPVLDLLDVIALEDSWDLPLDARPGGSLFPRVLVGNHANISSLEIPAVSITATDWMESPFAF